MTAPHRPRALPLVPKLSDDAAGLIRSLASKARAVTGSGLRISVDRRHDSLSMELVPTATYGDVVVLNGGASLFVSPAASRRLSGRTLRASTPPERSAFFLT
jgi:Fe-S cluster assembly iron-binding protein IscA